MSIIKIENLSKKYKITHQQGKYVALRDVLAGILRNPLYFLRKKINQPFKHKDDFWALKNINLNIEKGEIVGIIGPNGAGKSTLLEVLSRITFPTEGKVTLNGKVSSLLEVGTGFHPELTGRENIFFNGAILGMSRREIAEKFDSIVEFAEVEKFIDTPVKYYSSGMKVRLAFSVAAHLEPDILIVDEVLSVGDADFQKKSLGKMDEVTKKQGRTILFVSHNMEAIQKLCSRTIFIKGGRIVKDGHTRDVVNVYLREGLQDNPKKTWDPENAPGDSVAKLYEIKVENTGGEVKNQFELKENIIIKIRISVSEKDTRLSPTIAVTNENNLVIFTTTEEINKTHDKGIYEKNIIIPGNLLSSGSYLITFSAVTNGIQEQIHIYAPNVISFMVYEDGTTSITPFSTQEYIGLVRPKVEWETKETT